MMSKIINDDTASVTSVFVELLKSAGYAIPFLLGPSTPISIAHAAWYLDLKPSSVERLVQERRIAFHRPGGKRVYFLKSDLDTYASLRRVESEMTVQREAVRIAAGFNGR